MVSESMAEEPLFIQAKNLAMVMTTLPPKASLTTCSDFSLTWMEVCGGGEGGSFCFLLLPPLLLLLLLLLLGGGLSSLPR